MENDYIRTVEEFKNPPSALVLIERAIHEIEPNKSNWLSSSIITLISAGLAFTIGFLSQTVELVHTICIYILEIQLALFGCVFTAYSIINAFFSDEYMKRLSQIMENDERSILMKSIAYYESVLFLFFIGIGSSGLVLIISSIIPPETLLFSNVVIDNILVSVLLFIYLLFSVRVFYEVKIVIYNTLMLYRQRIAFKFLDFASQDRCE